jgi:hypothetical protein
MNDLESLVLEMLLLYLIGFELGLIVGEILKPVLR